MVLGQRRAFKLSAGKLGRPKAKRNGVAYRGSISLLRDGGCRTRPSRDIRAQSLEHIIHHVFLKQLPQAFFLQIFFNAPPGNSGAAFAALW